MRVQFWGTRGSIAKPGPSMARYGGNTSCVEVRSARGTLVIVDCGTGAHPLGQNLMSAGAEGLRGHILISHTHWDHIQGIPFFAPLFVPGNEWDIYGPKGLGQSLRETLAGQMQYAFSQSRLMSAGPRSAITTSSKAPSISTRSRSPPTISIVQRLRSVIGWRPTG